MPQPLVARAQQGDRAAFDELVEPMRGALRSFVLRMVAHGEDAEELTQDALLKAYKAIDSFREDSSMKTWLFSIATRVALDHLRKRKRWSERAQLKAGDAMYDRPEVVQAFQNAVAEPDFVFSVREHIAFCFSCIGRSLTPEQAAAIHLREVFELGNREAAASLSMTESVFRHTLAEARRIMRAKFENLCTLVSKQGVCYQCTVLREQVPESKRGDAVEKIETFEERLRIVGDADLADGQTARMHDDLFTFVGSMEAD